MSCRMMIVGVGLCSLMLTAAAGADLIDVRFAGTGLGRNVKISYNDWSKNVFAGQMRHEITTPEGHWLESGEHLTYCIEITESVSTSFKPFTIAPLWQAPDTLEMGTMKAQAIADLFAFAGDQPFATEATGANRDFAAAFQIVLWEIIYDFDGTAASLDVSAGDLIVQNTSGGSLSSGIAGAFDSLVAGLMTNGGLGSLSGVAAISRAGVQDQVLLVPGPAALAMIGVAFAARRRRSTSEE